MRDMSIHAYICSSIFKDVYASKQEIIFAISYLITSKMCSPFLRRLGYILFG